MRKVTNAEGFELHYEVHDYTDPWLDAPYLILQHGYGRSSKLWYNMIPYLARYYRVVCPNLRGLGGSGLIGNPDDAINVDAYVSDLVCVIESLDHPSVHYAGESLGALLGIALSARHPKMVRTLSMFSGILKIIPEGQKTLAYGYENWQEALRQLGSLEWARRTNAAVRFPPNTDQRLLDWYAGEIGKAPVEVLIAMSRLACTVDATPMLTAIECPVLAMFPVGGSLSTGSQEETMRKDIRNINVIHVPTPYHMIQTMAPATCAKHVLHFMATHDGRVCHEL